MEPFTHPDLAALGRRLRAQMDVTLEAEQTAARAAARRRRSLRDVLLVLEDRAEPVVLQTATGDAVRGTLLAVGVDHVEVGTRSGGRLVAIGHIVSIQAAP